jgi:RND family efflux transporter MFP subunit
MTQCTKITHKSGVAAAFLTLLLTACSGEGGNAGQGGGFFDQNGGGNVSIPAVEAVQATLGTLPLEDRVTGRVIARNQTEIYPEVSGTIVEIFVENGDEVKVGDPLVRMRDAEFSERYQQALSGLEIARAQTQQARANLGLIQSQVQRTESLVARNLENNVNLETVKSQLAIAQADLDLRQAQENQAKSAADERLLQLQNATIRAPISGTVGQRNAEIGQLANTSTRLFVVGELSAMRIELMLSDRMLDHMGIGVPVSVSSTSWGPEKVLTSSISRISPFLDATTMRTQAFVELENDQNLLRPGMFVTVDIRYGESEQSVLIPNSALYRHPQTGIEGIYVVADSDEPVAAAPQSTEAEGVGILAPPRPVNFIPVEIVATGRMATAVKGVNAGDTIVTVGQNLLQSGAKEVRARLLPWDNMMELQELQSEDMLEIIGQNREEARKS